MKPVLVGDIGGTNSRLKLLEINPNKDLLETNEIDKHIYSTSKSISLQSIIIEFLEKYKNTNKYPKLAIIGIPTTVINNKIMNLFCFKGLVNKTGEEVAEEVGIEKVIFLNDFVINGYYIQSKQLNEGIDYIQINSGINPIQNMVKVLVGPGTGLGICFLTKSPNEKYYTVNSSGCLNFNFAPDNDKQEKFRKFLIESYKSYNITNPDIALLCRGPTIIQILKFLNREEKIEGNKDVLNAIKDAENDNDKLNEVNKVIVKLAIENKCLLCKKTIDFYLEIFGYICSNIALTFLSFGGFYLVGGLISTLSDYIKKSNIFLDNFYKKNFSQDKLKKIPIFIILNKDIGLEGATFYAKKYINENNI